MLPPSKPRTGGCGSRQTVQRPASRSLASAPERVSLQPRRVEGSAYPLLFRLTRIARFSRVGVPFRQQLTPPRPQQGHGPYPVSLPDIEPGEGWPGLPVRATYLRLDMHVRTLRGSGANGATPYGRPPV